jgi:hypothetical protein
MRVCHARCGVLIKAELIEQYDQPPQPYSHIRYQHHVPRTDSRGGHQGRRKEMYRHLHRPPAYPRESLARAITPSYTLAHDPVRADCSYPAKRLSNSAKTSSRPSCNCPTGPLPRCGRTPRSCLGRTWKKRVSTTKRTGSRPRRGPWPVPL